MFQDRGRERILDDVSRRVSGGQSNGDDEIGGDESKQYEYEEFPFPAREQMFKHGDGAFTMRTLFGDTVINRQRTEKREQHQYDCRDRRKCLGGEERDAGLVAESREIVDTGQTHYLPPRMLLVSYFRSVSLNGAFE